MTFHTYNFLIFFLPAAAFLYWIANRLDRTEEKRILRAYLALLSVGFTVSAGWICTLTILTGIASGPAGFLLGLQVAAESYVPMGISAEACRYLLICTFTILDTLPTSMGFLMLTSWAGVKVKDAYPCVFKSTVILPAIATVLCLIIFMVFPGLAMVGA